MEQAWETLEQLGAVDYDGNLTALGRHMVFLLLSEKLLSVDNTYQAMLPLDLRLSKILILGTLFGCLSPALSIAACLSSKPLFLNPMDRREEANKFVFYELRFIETDRYQGSLAVLHREQRPTH